MDILCYPFMQRALLSATLIGTVCAVIGVYVVLRSMAFIGAGVAHASFGGVALGFLLGINPFFTTILFCLATAWGIAFLSEERKVSEDSAVGVFFASTMAFGVLLIGFMKGYQADLFGYLFGNILAVSRFDLISSLIIGAMVLALVWFFFKEFLLLTFDPEMAKVTGLKVKGLNLLMMSLIAVTIVLSIKSVGIVLVSALIVTPAASALLLSDDFKKMMGLAILIGVGSTWIGLLLSVWLNLASGATIVTVATLIFFLCYFSSPERRKLLRNIEQLRSQMQNRL
ncbi:MAG TPA: metal ABC transporter permease [bacterium]|nr:metal ABC transporter permease [bacterium]HPR88597.1 metal ABC transporter permease [bacterium]